MTPSTTSPIASIRHTTHQPNQYSITMEFANVHVSLSTHSYPHRPGSSTDVAIFDLTPDDLLRLGNLITAEAFKVKGRQEAGNADQI